MVDVPTNDDQARKLLDTKDLLANNLIDTIVSPFNNHAALLNYLVNNKVTDSDFKDYEKNHFDKSHLIDMNGGILNSNNDLDNFKTPGCWDIFGSMPQNGPDKTLPFGRMLILTSGNIEASGGNFVIQLYLSIDGNIYERFLSGYPASWGSWYIHANSEQYDARNVSWSTVKCSTNNYNDTINYKISNGILYVNGAISMNDGDTRNTNSIIFSIPNVHNDLLAMQLNGSGSHYQAKEVFDFKDGTLTYRWGDAAQGDSIWVPINITTPLNK